MPILEVSEISKSFSDGYAVESVSLTAERGEIVCLLGPSGCGKTTLLRLIAGLEEPDRGSISFDGRALNGLLPRERGFGLMFQDLALFPHMDVAGNVSFGLRMQHLERRASVNAWTNSLRWSTSLDTGTERFMNSQVANDNVSPWRGHWRLSRNY